MTDMIMVYVTCQSKQQAEDIGEALLKKRLVACTDCIDQVKSQYFWPPKSNAIDCAQQVILLCMTLQDKWTALEKEVIRLHSDTTPCIIAIPVANVSQKYYSWLKSELS